MQFRTIFFLSLFSIMAPTYALVTGAALVTILGAIVGGATGYVVHEEVHYRSEKNCKKATAEFHRLVNTANVFDQAAQEKSVDPLMPIFHTSVHKRHQDGSSVYVSDLINDAAKQASDRIAMLHKEMDDLTRYSYFHAQRTTIEPLQTVEALHDTFYKTNDDGIFSKENRLKVQTQMLKDLHQRVENELNQDTNENSAYPLHERLKKLEYHVGLYENFVKHNNCMTSEDFEVINHGKSMANNIKSNPEYQLEAQSLEIQHLKNYILTLQCRIAQLEGENTRLRTHNRSK